MSDREPPCDHTAAQVGRVRAGELAIGSVHCSVYTCLRCVAASQDYVTAETGLPASDLIPFAKYSA